VALAGAVAAQFVGLVAPALAAHQAVQAAAQYLPQGAVEDSVVAVCVHRHHVHPLEGRLAEPAVLAQV